jgi:hypothetical protein
MPLNPIFRRFIAGASVIGGLFVLYFEMVHASGDRWFWMFIAGLAVVLGMIELMSKDKPAPPQ